MNSIVLRYTSSSLLFIACILGTSLCNGKTPVLEKNKTSTKSLSTSGACTKSDRQKVMYRTNHRLSETWEACGRKVYGNGPRTAQCVKNAFPELTDACAGCIGAMTACSKSHCMWECMLDSKNANCQQCTQEYCKPALYKCTGIPAHEFPGSVSK